MYRVLPLFKRLASFLAVLALAAALCGAAGGTSKPLSLQDRTEVFEKSWKAISDHYYDPEFHGVNWVAVREKYQPLVEVAKDDEEFYELMSRMTGALHDAHTRFSSPERWEDRMKHQGAATGMRVGFVEGKVAIVDVLPGASAAQAGIEPGMIVISVGGKPVGERIAEAEKRVTLSSSERFTRLIVLRSVFGGTLEETLIVGLERADGSRFEVKLTRQVLSVAPHVTSRMLDAGFGYMRFDQFHPSITKEFKEELEKNRNAPGLILDLRSNGGGNGDVLQTIAGYFYNKKTLLAKRMSRKQVAKSERDGGNEEQSDAYAGKEGQQIYAGPVVVLISEYSGSATELFAAGMQDTGRAKIVGSQSCGCVLGITKNRMMKGGGVLEISEVLWFSPKGRKLEGEGVIPDRAAAPTIASLRQKRDLVLDEAEKILREMTAAKTASAGR